MGWLRSLVQIIARSCLRSKCLSSKVKASFLMAEAQMQRKHGGLLSPSLRIGMLSLLLHSTGQSKSRGLTRGQGMRSSSVDITSTCHGCLQPMVGSQFLEAEFFSPHVPKRQKTHFLLDPLSQTEGRVILVGREDP